MRHWIGAALVAGLPLVAMPLAALSAPFGLPPLPRPPAAPVALGKAFFFDRRLSFNGTLSCAMCHVPEQGFTSNSAHGGRHRGHEPEAQRADAAERRLAALAVPRRARARSSISADADAAPGRDGQSRRGRACRAQRAAACPRHCSRAHSATRGRHHRTSRLTGCLSAHAAGRRFALRPLALRRRCRRVPAAARRGFEVFRAQGCDRCHLVGTTRSLFTDHGFHNVGVAWRSQADSDTTSRCSWSRG